MSHLWQAAAFMAVVALIALDLLQDWRSGGEPLHLGLEGLAMGIATIGGALSARAVVRARAEAAEARAGAEAARVRADELAAEGVRWRVEARTLLAGLGEAIDQQFARWGLTAAEREVALLLLKGLGTQRIAELRQTSDRTVRQQARSVYAKAGLAGRAELAAFFLEDLLLPR